MVIGILLMISVLANIILFGMLAFLLGQRKKERELMGKKIRDGVDRYLEITLKSLDERMKKETEDLMTKGFGDEKNKH